MPTPNNRGYMARQTGGRSAARSTEKHGALKTEPEPARPGRRRLPRIGAQISTAGGFAPVPDRAVTLGAEAVQIFNSNPRMWHTRPVAPDEMAALISGLRKHRLPLFFHTIYLINLATPDEGLRTRSSLSLAHALVTGSLAGAAGVVTHVGSHRGEGFETAIELVVTTIRAAEDAAWEALAAQSPVASGSQAALPPLLLETAAGAGALVGKNLEELSALLDALAHAGARQEGAPPPATKPIRRPLDLGLCLDTAHLFAAGYPVHEAAGLEALIDELEQSRLLSRVGLIHLNDSATPFASNRDRHANPGEGFIGYDGLARVVRHPALARIPFVLEVPGAEGHGPDANNVALVKAMRAGTPRRPTGSGTTARPAGPGAPSRPGAPAPGG